MKKLRKRARKKTYTKMTVVFLAILIIVSIAIFATFSSPPPANKYEMDASFINNSNNYNISYPQLPSTSRVYVFPNNTTAIYDTIFVNKSSVHATNTVIQAYSIVEVYGSQAEATAVFNLKKQGVLALVNDTPGNRSIYATPSIGNETLGHLNVLFPENQTLYIVQFTVGDAFARVGVYETINSSPSSSIALAEKLAHQMES
jgi:hypothetical protein